MFKHEIPFFLTFFSLSLSLDFDIKKDDACTSGKQKSTEDVNITQKQTLTRDIHVRYVFMCVWRLWYRTYIRKCYKFSPKTSDYK